MMSIRKALDLPGLLLRADRKMRRLISWLWLLRRFGLRRTLLYRRAYRERWIIDYSKIFSPEELAKLSKYGLFGEMH